MAKNSGNTRSSAGSSVKVSGDVGRISYVRSVINEVNALNKEYGTHINEVIVKDANGRRAYADHHEGALNIYNDYDKQVEWNNHNVGFTGDANEAGKAIAAHEFAHSLTDGLGWLDDYDMTWEDFKVDQRKNGFKVAEAQKHYDNYKQRRREILKKRASDEKVIMLKELADVDRRYQAQLEKDYMIPGIEPRREALRKHKISGYAKQGSQEFVAEAFAFARLYPGKNPFADEVKKIIDNFYKKKQL